MNNTSYFCIYRTSKSKLNLRFEKHYRHVTCARTLASLFVDRTGVSVRTVSLVCTSRRYCLVGEKKRAKDETRERTRIVLLTRYWVSRDPIVSEITKRAASVRYGCSVMKRR